MAFKDIECEKERGGTMIFTFKVYNPATIVSFILPARDLACLEGLRSKVLMLRKKEAEQGLVWAVMVARGQEVGLGRGIYFSNNPHSIFLVKLPFLEFHLLDIIGNKNTKIP